MFNLLLKLLLSCRMMAYSTRYISVNVLLILVAYSSTLEEWPRESYHRFQADTMGFDHIYVINLERRPERRIRLLKMADQLKIKLSFFNAIDGRNLTQSKVEELGISILPNYTDRATKRVLKFGEIGCALSHYAVWEDMIWNCYKKVLILEDDAMFLPMARKRWSRMSAELDEFVPNWDLVFLGRRPLLKFGKDTRFADSGCLGLVWPNYSYWLVAYALSNNGARKLTSRNFLSNLIPVDEYVPIMYDRHPNEQLKNNYWPRDLIAVSTSPLLIQPTWVNKLTKFESDTEDTDLIV